MPPMEVLTRTCSPGPKAGTGRTMCCRSACPGEQVRVSTSMGGMHVVVTGQSLGTGVPGQSVRVRLAGGKVVTGTVQEDQTVLISL